MIRSDQIKNTVDQNAPKDTRSLRILKKAGRTVYKRICPKCGRLFMTIDENKFDCQDCIGNEVKERLRKPKKKDDAIKAVNHMARASGMSYGKFVAQMSMEPLERK